MHALFAESHPQVKCSYHTYRSIVSKMNISFAKLGHEECGVCEAYMQHDENHVKNQKEEAEVIEHECEVYCQWMRHKRLAKEARELYVKHASSKEWSPDNVCYSADLQKVIMLPRMDTFKEVLFTKRIIAFNESFVPVGETQPWIQPQAVIWHEGCSGRKKEDIISSFHAFFLSQRDALHITLWLDNCAAQNKNWAFFSYLIFIINSNLIAAESITINYFEPGHTFMSADSFHHQVELQMKEAGKVYDFADFNSCIARTCKGQVTVREMGMNDFFDWKDFSSQHKLKNMVNRPYLGDIVKVRVKRGDNTLLYQRSHQNEEFKVLNFVLKKYEKNMALPSNQKIMRGVPEEKKRDIISKLAPLMPPHKRVFWENLPSSEDVKDLVVEDDD